MSKQTMYDNEGNAIEVPRELEEARQAAFKEMNKKSILVALNRRQFHNIPIDIEFTEQVCDSFGIKDKTRIQVRKHLINPEHLSKIRSIMNDANLMVWTNTRPWENMSYRLLPMAYHNDFVDTFTKQHDDFEEERQNIVDHWDEWVAEAKKTLGKAFNKNNYPDASQVKDLFELEIETTPLPDIDDVRLNLIGPELVKMQRQIAQKFDDGIEKYLDFLEKYLVTNAQEANTLIAVAKQLNANDVPEYDMRITELEAKYGSEAEKPEPKEVESMMVMEDIDSATFDEDADDFLELL